MKIALIPYGLDTSTVLQPPLKYFVEKIWNADFLTIDKLDSREGKDQFIIVSFLQVGAKDYFEKKLQNLISKYPNNRKVLVILEPPVVAPFMYSKKLHTYFDLILTRNKSLLKKNNYKWLPTIPFEMKRPKIQPRSFNEKKFLTLINWNKYSFVRNELYSRREKAIRYYEKNGKEFDLYWFWWDKPNFKQKIFWYQSYPSYKWPVDDKIETLSQYKFNICFENMCKVDGYVTEKIWESLQARSVPIYRGANDITDYIPETCFIDFRKFDKNFDKLTSYLENMKESEYNAYIYEINKFMDDESKFKERFGEWWAENLISIITDFFGN